MESTATGKTIAANTGWRMAGSIGRLGMQTIWTVCLSRWLTPGDFGVLTYAVVIVGFADMASQMGVGPALIQKEELTDRCIRAGFTLSLMMGLGAGLSVLLLAPILAFGDATTTNVIRVLSSVFLVMGINVVSSALLQRQHRFKELVAAECVAYFFGYLVVSLGLAIVFRNVWCLVAGMLANLVLRAGLNWWHVRHSLCLLFSWQDIASLLRFGFVFTVTRVLNYGANSSDAFLTRNLFGESELGLYARAFLLVRIPAALTTRSMHSVLFPAFSRISDRDRIRRAYQKATMFGLCLLVPLCCVVCLTAPEIIVVPFGKKWAGAIVPLQILAPVAFLGMYTLGDAVLKAINRLRAQLVVHATFFSIVVILVLACSRVVHGINGVALGVLVANVVMYVHMSFVCTRALEGTFLDFLRAHIPSVLIGCFVLVVGLSIRLAMTSLDCQPWVTWIGVTIGCAVAFFSISIVPVHRELIEYQDLFSQFAIAACSKNRHASRVASCVFRGVT